MPDIVKKGVIPLKTPIDQLKEDTSVMNEITQEVQTEKINDFANQQDAQRNGDAVIANKSGLELYGDQTYPLGTAVNRPQYTDPNLKWSVHDLTRTFGEEAVKGFMRGVGQTISSNGDLINFIGSAFPGIDMLNGNIIGNAIKSAGDSIEQAYASYMPKELENITWGSLANPDFYSHKVSEMIPLALEFVLASKGVSGAARKGANKLAGEMGEQGLKKAVQTTSTSNKLKGLTQVEDVIGTGKGWRGKLIRNVDGKGELTALGNDAVSMFSAGVTSNLMAGGMNAMDLHNQMKMEKNPDGSQKYTEEEMADAAAGAFTMNMAYIPVDILSWGITYGGGLKNITKGMMPKNGLIKSGEEIMAQASSYFTSASMPLMKAAVRASGKILPAAQKAFFEGMEEQFQESFEEWAKLKGKESATGEQAPDYWTFFNSDENRATRVLSFASGALMGGAFNASEIFNKNADQMLKYYNRTENLRATFDANDKLGQEAREMHIQDQMFDLIYEDKQEFFGDFLSSMVQNGQLSEEQAASYEDLFGKISEDIDLAKNLNVAGKEALMRNTVKANFLQESIERDVAARDEIIAGINQQFEEGPERDAAIKKQVAAINESINAKVIMLSKAKANKLNLISGKIADPLDIKFVVSKTGKEFLILDPKRNIISNEDNTNPVNATGRDAAQAYEQGGIVSGLSDQQYDEYVNMTDEEVFEKAKGFANTQQKGLRGRAKEFYETLKKTYIPDETEAQIEEKQPLDEEAEQQQEQPMSEEKPVTQKPAAKQDSAKRKDDENDFEKSAIDEENFLDEKKKPLRQKQEEEDNQVLEDFKNEEKKPERKKRNLPEDLVKNISNIGTVDEYEQYLDTIFPESTNQSVFQNRDTKIRDLKNFYGGVPTYFSEPGYYEEFGNIVQHALLNVKKAANLGADIHDKSVVNVLKNLMESGFDAATARGRMTPGGRYFTERSSGLDYFMALNPNATEQQIKEFTDAQEAITKEDFEGVENPSFVDNFEFMVFNPDQIYILGTDEDLEGFRNFKASQSNSGKASLIPKFLKKKTVSAPTKQEVERLTGEINAMEDLLYKNVANKMFSNNPTVIVSKNDLDAYLNTAISKFTKGPNMTQKMIALNNRFKSMGINVDVIAAENLYRTVGLDATGYAIANTIFIDEKAWEQSEILMHEMSHIYYRTMKDEAATKAVISRAQTNTPLVNKLKQLYYNDIVFDVGDGVFMSLRDIDVNADSYEQAVQTMESYGFKEAPLSEQNVINEELFVNELQGPLSKKFSTFFKPSQEYGRKKISKGWWAWLRDKSVTNKQSNIDVVKALNDGKNVSPEDIREHIMNGFVDAISKNKEALSAQGSASLISKMNKQQKEEIDAITPMKLNQQNKFDKEELRQRLMKSIQEKENEKIVSEIRNQENLTPDQQNLAIDYALQNLEDSYEEGNMDDDFNQVKTRHMNGATRILNNFVKSLNYVRRQKFLKNENNLPSDYNPEMELDRDALISEFFNLAYETKGNTNLFINAIENSDIQEVDAFSKYLDKLYPKEKYAVLNSMGWVMSNMETISGIKSYVDANGRHINENALSVTEKNAVDSQMKRMEGLVSSYYRNINDGNQDYNEDSPVEKFITAYNNARKGAASKEDYLEMLRFLAPYNVRVANIIRSNNISFKGAYYTVTSLLDNFAKKNVLKNPTSPNSIYIPKARSVVEALVDTNRKFTSYSSIENAEGNMEPSKITNNHLLSEMRSMNEMLSKKPSFKKFKEQFGHINDASKRKGENPVLKSIYDNYMNNKTVPGITQYFGLKHDQAKSNSLFKNSTDFTQSIEDFMMFDSSANSYLQNMGAFADSPRKFMLQVNKIKFDDAFNSDGSLKSFGTTQLRTAFNIYSDLNKNLSDTEKAGTIQNYDDFVKAFNKSVQAERKLWNTFGKDLKASKNLTPYFDAKGRLNMDGNKKLTEFVFNSTVNGLAISEIFNPGIPVKDITKRNKGNSSPINSFGNKNLKIEPIVFPDTSNNSTDSGMYMLREDAEKIVKAGLGVFDLNNGLKLMNYSIDRDNPAFAGKTAYFKGYTTILDENMLKNEPGLKGIHEMLMRRRAKHDIDFYKKNEVYPSEDLLNGESNYLNIAIPVSSIKSDWLTPEQQSKINGLTLERMNDAIENNDESDFETMEKVYDEMFYGPDGFIGISGYNFGPQQVMDKITVDSITPVQFISSLIVNGTSQGTLEKAEEIQKLIRVQESKAMDAIFEELNNMDPKDYKKFILKNLDLDRMDQGQRMIIESNVNSLNHIAIEDFVINTLANRLKTAGNKLKTAGTIAQQKPDTGYRNPSVNGVQYYTAGADGIYTDRIKGYSQREDGGLNPLEIVLPKHMEKNVRKREYFTLQDDAAVMSRIKGNTALLNKWNKSDEEGKLEILKTVAMKAAMNSYPRVDNEKSYGFRNADLFGTVQDKNGKVIGYYVKGDIVIGTRVPSHGPASTGVFEAIDFLSGEGNQTVVSHEFSEVIGSDYDGDGLFIQKKTKGFEDFNKALDKTVELWTSPEMADQVRAKIDFKDEVQNIIKNNKSSKEVLFPMSPEYNRNSYNNTMVSKRSIGTIFNMHRLANYLAAYDVKIKSPFTINGTRYEQFEDTEAGQNSRNNKSAQLANIILDNTKWHFADALGLNDQTINQFSLLTNMGVSLSDLNKIMNSTAVKTWVKYKKNNLSPYLKNRTNAEIMELIQKDPDMQIDSRMKPNSIINTADLETPQQKVNVLNLMSELEKMNSEVLKLSKIMAGHKGIENNPFILEKQLKDFNDVVNNNQESIVLNDRFKNNPDVSAYQNNASRILETLKTANKIYRKSTAELMSVLDNELAINGMTENQLSRASDILKKFVNSRILGHNNIPMDEKEKIRNRIFDKLFDYMDSLKQVELKNDRNGLEKSLLFNRALNIYFSATKNGIDPAKSYVSANPRFFNESLSLEEKRAVQREFQELPTDIKDDLIAYDLMKNGMSGNLSLVHVFDDMINESISFAGYFDSVNKNEPISKSVMDDLKDIIVSNELLSPDSSLPTILAEPGTDISKNIAQLVSSKNGVLFRKMAEGSPAIFAVNLDGKKTFYRSSGLSSKEVEFLKNIKNPSDRKIAITDYINNSISKITPLDGDLGLKAMSIADNVPAPILRSYESNNTDGNADYMIEANIIQDEKKNDSQGRASMIDYHNYNEVRPLSRQEYDRVMEYNPVVSELQKENFYNLYLAEKKEANDLADKINQVTVSKMSDDKLKSLYNEFSDKDAYAYSIVTTPVIMEFANRASIEQSKITERYEDGSDISLLSSWMNNNNIPSNHPATQALVRQLNDQYKTFVKERGKYVKKINEATEALYKKKFNLSNNRIIATGQKIFNTLFRNRNDIYQILYGNIIENEVVKLPNGKTTNNFKLKDEKEIENLKNSNQITQEEYDFYKAFTEITKELEPFGAGNKIRKGYIPHTSMGNLEMFAGRGLLGLLVNSKPENDAINDVKLWREINGKKELIPFSDIKNEFNVAALSSGNKFSKISEFNALKSKAKKLLKERKNEDGSAIEYSRLETATVLGMGTMSRFSNSRSMKAEEMPSMDLNKALVDYVHSTLFSRGNGKFEGFQNLMPLIDGVMAYNDKTGYKNTYNYVKDVIKEKFINKKDQNVLGPKGDKIVNGLVKGNLLYALGYKGFVVGKGLYAIGNIAIGKYSNIKREGGRQWLKGELRYWGTDKGFNVDALDRRRRAKKILSNLGFMEIDIYDDVAIQKKSGLDGIFTSLALLPMSKSEDWIQKAHFLGMLTDEEFDRFDADGNYKTGAVHIPQERIIALEERVKNSHGKGYTPTDQSRIQTYSLGRMMLQFSRHLPTHIRERFAKEDVDMYGNQNIGSMRQMYVTVSDIVNNKISPDKFKEYYNNLQPHQKEALKAGMRGMAMVSLLGFVDASMTDTSNQLSGDNISRGVIGDSNIHFDLQRMQYKMVPPSIRSLTSLLYGAGNSNTSQE